MLFRSVDPIVAVSGQAQIVSADVPANGVRLFPIKLPPGHSLALGVNGSPLVQMSVFDAEGKPLEAKGPLRVVTLPGQPRSPLQLLVSNEGVASALVRLSLRADPPPAAPSQPGDAAPGAQIVPFQPHPPSEAAPGSGPEAGNGEVMTPPQTSAPASAPTAAPPTEPLSPPSATPPASGPAGRTP